MSELARRNGWRGFDSLDPDEVDGGWEYQCEAIGPWGPSGCEPSGHVTVNRKWTTVGKKKNGFVVCYGVNDADDPGDDGQGHDLDVVLVLCHKHAAPATAAEVTP